MSRILSTNFSEKTDPEIILSKIKKSIDNNQQDYYILGTHNGVFHCDEVAAISIFKHFVKQYSGNNLNIEIMRSRNYDTLSLANVRLDVGSDFNVDTLTFDHHQKGFEFFYNIQEPLQGYASSDFRNYTIPMATCGMMWEIFGHEIINNFVPKISDKNSINRVYENIRDFLFQIDATDTGFVSSLGKFFGTPISSCISLLNSEDVNDNPSQINQMKKAIDFFSEILFSKIRNAINRINFEKEVFKAAEEAKNGIMVLSTSGPWVETVLNNWERFENIKVCVFSLNEADYRIMTLPKVREDRMSMRCPAPVEWRGEKPEKLNEMIGIDDAIFVHPAGFIGGAKSLYSIATMAEKWVNSNS